MATFVGLPNADNIDTKKDDWYLEYSWDEETQDKFKEWLVDYLKDKKASRSISNSYSNSKERRIKLANEFILMYGWKSL